uniref:Uncharacterized protein n=1 Tax=Phthorimaea operculella granulovirus TaxID=192584 RepID=A0A1B2CRZ2_9BBAC|nr:hypothetical protein PhopGVgp025 [Phthorimaea operculella granulovirus]
MEPINMVEQPFDIKWVRNAMKYLMDHDLNEIPNDTDIDTILWVMLNNAAKHIVLKKYKKAIKILNNVLNIVQEKFENRKRSRSSTDSMREEAKKARKRQSRNSSLEDFQDRFAMNAGINVTSNRDEMFEPNYLGNVVYLPSYLPSDVSELPFSPISPLSPWKQEERVKAILNDKTDEQEYAASLQYMREHGLEEEDNRDQALISETLITQLEEQEAIAHLEEQEAPPSDFSEDEEVVSRKKITASRRRGILVTLNSDRNLGIYHGTTSYLKTKFKNLRKNDSSVQNIMFSCDMSNRSDIKSVAEKLHSKLAISFRSNCKKRSKIIYLTNSEIQDGNYKAVIGSVFDEHNLESAPFVVSQVKPSKIKSRESVDDVESEPED